MRARTTRLILSTLTVTVHGIETRTATVSAHHSSGDRNCCTGIHYRLYCIVIIIFVIIFVSHIGTLRGGVSSSRVFDSYLMFKRTGIHFFLILYFYHLNESRPFRTTTTTVNVTIVTKHCPFRRARWYCTAVVTGRRTLDDGNTTTLIFFTPIRSEDEANTACVSLLVTRRKR
jgi:hypothetical protein